VHQKPQSEFSKYTKIQHRTWEELQLALHLRVHGNRTGTFFRRDVSETRQPYVVRTMS
jgi:hypothetical protein